MTLKLRLAGRKGIYRYTKTGVCAIVYVNVYSVCEYYVCDIHSICHICIVYVNSIEGSEREGKAHSVVKSTVPRLLVQKT